MKHLFGIVLCLLCTVDRTIAQNTNPIYGLGLCSVDTYPFQKTNLQHSVSNALLPVIADSSLQSFLLRFEKGLHSFINGDATLWKQHVSQKEDVTIMGGFGAYKKGWKQVGPRYDWAAARFLPSGAKAAIEYLSVVSNGELAYTISIERSQVHLADTDKVGPMTLRVTHIFRKEADEWKLVHRHADHVMEKNVPASVLKK